LVLVVAGRRTSIVPSLGDSWDVISIDVMFTLPLSVPVRPLLESVSTVTIAAESWIQRP